MSGHTSKRKSDRETFLGRLDLLKSLDLTPVAADVTNRRETIRGEPLPRDKRADASRMKRALLAMHQIVGHNRTWVCTVEKIAAEMNVGQRTVRRAVADLEEACLIDVQRRERARRKGGQRRRAALSLQDWPVSRTPPSP